MGKTHKDARILDLHNFRASGWQFFENELFQKIDNFVYHSQQSGQKKVEIVVGRGINSKNQIEGKNPLRFYTEKYLQQAGLTWQAGVELNRNSGTIVVWLD